MCQGGLEEAVNLETATIQYQWVHLASLSQSLNPVLQRKEFRIAGETADSEAVVKETEHKPMACCSGRKIKRTWPHQRDTGAKWKTLLIAKFGSIWPTM